MKTTTILAVLVAGAMALAQGPQPPAPAPAGQGPGPGPGQGMGQGMGRGQGGQPGPGRGFRMGPPGMWWTRPELVQAVHRAYVEAGAEVLLTNTFQANPQHLRTCGIQGKMDALYLAGAHLARKAGNGVAIVLASIGPTIADSDVEFESLARTAAYLDAIMLETWGNLDAAAHFADCD